MTAEVLVIFETALQRVVARLAVNGRSGPWCSK